MATSQESKRSVGGRSYAPATIVWTIVAVVVTGALIGWVVGLSESPVAGVVLPLIFALLAGAGGFHFATHKPSDGESDRLASLAAQATTAFTIACAVGLHFGIQSRLGEETRPPVSDDELVGSKALEDLSASEVLRISAIEKKLLLMGVDPEVRELFVTKFVDRYADDVAALRSERSPTVQDLLQLKTALDSVWAEVEGAEELARTATPFREFRAKLPTYLGHVDNLRKYVGEGSQSVPPDHYRRLLDFIDEDLEAVIRHKESSDDGTTITPPPRMNYIPLYGLALIIDVQKEPLQTDWDVSSTILDREDIEMLDETVKLISPGDAEDAPPPRRRYAIAP